MSSAAPSSVVYGTLFALAAAMVGCSSEPVSEPLEPVERPRPVASPELTPIPEPEVIPFEVEGTASFALEPYVEPVPYPFVLVHGFTGFSDLGPLDYFFGVENFFRELGSEAFAPAQPPYASSQTRANVLANPVDQILSATGAEKVHLICHSQGGLDCRQLVAHVPTMESKVSTIITIATPHFGTPLADLALAAPDGLVNPAGRFLGWMLGALEGAPPDESAWTNDDDTEVDDWDPKLSDAIALMSSEGAAAFNVATPDTSVPIFSVAGFSNLVPATDLCDGGLLWDRPSRVDAMDALLLANVPTLSDYSILRPRLNDGVVPTDSMIWGTFLGCIPADHLDEVGQIADLAGGLISGFDHIDFYGELHGFARQLEAEQRAAAGQ